MLRQPILRHVETAIKVHILNNPAYNVAKSKKPRTIGEELIELCAVEMARIMLGNDAGNKLKLIPLSSNIISNRIRDISIDMRSQTLDHKKTSLATI